MGVSVFEYFLKSVFFGQDTCWCVDCNGSQILFVRVSRALKNAQAKMRGGHPPAQHHPQQQQQHQQHPSRQQPKKDDEVNVEPNV